MNNFLVIILIGILSTILILLVQGYTSYSRALANKPYYIKYGMYFKDRKLIGTETEVMLDPKSGITWLGKTRIKNIYEE